MEQIRNIVQLPTREEKPTCEAISTPSNDSKPDADREAVIYECLVLIYAAYERELPEYGSLSLSVKISAWKLSLQEIPSVELKRIVMAEIQNRTSEFLPVPADLIRRWKGDSDEPAVANAAAYEPLQPTANELAAKALPSGDQERFRAEWQALGEKLRRDKKAGYGFDAMPRQTPATSQQLSRAMFDWLHMATHRVSEETRINFGLWLLERYPVEQWTPELGREQWRIYHENQKAAS